MIRFKPIFVLLLLSLTVSHYAGAKKAKTSAKSCEFSYDEEGYCSKINNGKMRIVIQGSPQYYSTANFPNTDCKGTHITDGQCYCFNGTIVFKETKDLSGVIEKVHNINSSMTGCGD